MQSGFAILGTLILTSFAAHAAESCDRACLEGFVNQYLDALAVHDAS
ncbi:MAG: hypothetical protein ACLPWF_07805 [Bryobacteraceae bacterium]